MKHTILSLTLLGASLAAHAIDDGTYYFYDAKDNAYLSRGANYGTRATIDRLGLPIEVQNNGSSVTLRYLDNPAGWQTKYLGNAGGTPYTDITGNSETAWTIVETADGLLLRNNSTNKYLVLGDAVGTGARLTSTKASATVFTLQSAEQYGEYLAQLAELPTLAHTDVDVTSLLQNPTMTGGVEGWTSTFSKNVGLGSALCEVYEGYGKLTQTLTGMPKGYYSLTMPAFYRDGSCANCVQYATAGYMMSNAYLALNGAIAPIRDWASDRAASANPNSMSDAAKLFQQGKYRNQVLGYVGDDGELTVSICCPQYLAYGWLIWGAATLTYWAEGDADEALLVILQSQARQQSEKLEALLAVKRTLSEELTAEATQLLADAKTAATVGELQSVVGRLEACYDACKAYRIPVDRSGDPYVAYLFAYFPNNNDENLYYAISKDGFNYTPMNNGQRVMASDSVALKRAIRDPHVLRGHDGAFYMVATDMKSSEGWASNRGIVMYRSTDLVHWTHSTVHFPTRFPEWSGVTRVWAPETIWDPNYENSDGTHGRYLVYFSLLTNDGKCTYDKVYYCYANDDFTDLMTEPRFFFDRGSSTIDADIVYDETDQLFHMIYKNEGSGGICQVTSYSLLPAEGEPDGSQWGKPSGGLQQTGVAVEGGGLFRLIGSNDWVLMYDCYNNGYYQFCTTSDWEHFSLQAQTYTSSAFTPRHGTVLPITQPEEAVLLKAFPTKGYEPTPSAIVAPQGAASSDACYDLLGRRADSMRPGQIYLKGGRKVVR